MNIFKGIIAGLIFVIIGSLLSIIIVYVYNLLGLKQELPQICSTYNKYRIMEVTLFFTGVFGFALLS